LLTNVTPDVKIRGSVQNQENQEANMSNKNFEPGDRIVLIHMHDDPYPVPDGTRGAVYHIDDMGHIHVRWDCGSGLAVVPGVDEYRHLTNEEYAEERNANNV
jgi:hypothetical protein